MNFLVASNHLVWPEGQALGAFGVHATTLCREIPEPGRHGDQGKARPVTGKGGIGNLAMAAGATQEGAS